MTTFAPFIGGLAIGLCAGLPWVFRATARLNERSADLLRKSAELEKESRELTREALAFRQISRGR